ncbi:MAG: hypothetical protein JNM20_16890, partial [Rhizobiales bacterium]|nr:hypothetical protein [Hyphomicrobiales bacterium]
INERSAEEAWLTDQLKLVDAYGSKANFITKILDNISATTTAGSNTGSNGAGEAATEAGGDAATTQRIANGELPSLTFDQNFKLLSAYRNLIRQRIIENRLDDRHDLEGNSLYILKFDSTVFGIPALRDRAIIQVRLMPPPELTRLASPNAENIVGALNSQPEILNYARTNFKKWQASLQARMNAAIQYDMREFKSGAFETYPQKSAVLDHLRRRVRPEALGGRDLEEIVRQVRSNEAVEDAASIEVLKELYTYFAKLSVSKVTGDNLSDVDIEMRPTAQPDRVAFSVITPLSRQYLLILAEFEAKTSLGPVIKVEPLISSVFFTGDNCKVREGTQLPDYFIAGFEKQKATLWQHFKNQIPSEGETLAAIVGEIDRQNRERGGFGNILQIANVEGLFETIDGAACPLAKGVTVESGLINFTRKIGNFNTYSYSVLPRESPVSVYSEIALTTRAAARFETAEIARRREAQSSGWELRPVLTTFGNTVRIAAAPEEAAKSVHGDTSKDTEPVVGWVIDLSAQSVNEGRFMSPVTISESVVAIVSVPAWWSELVVRIDRGWLDSGNLGDEIAPDVNPITYFVKLPNRAELLDTLLFGAEGRQPLITGYDITGASMSNRCDDIAVLVTGPRLWRNTAVTIGSLRADEIQVLPNMEGIIAKFRTRATRQSAEPQGGPDPAGAAARPSIKGKLRVWTSDGMDETTDDVTLSSPEGC